MAFNIKTKIGIVMKTLAKYWLEIVKLPMHGEGTEEKDYSPGAEQEGK